jgi:glycine/D-amino acid oxidase-like deaminating enzyme
MNDAAVQLPVAPDSAVSAMPPSLWAATAPEGPRLEALTGSRRTEVAVVGAGYTGLSTALHLASAGIECTVIDRHEPGWGASGRNGGQVLPGLRLQRAELRGVFGTEVGDGTYERVETAADFLFALVERHGIDCDLVKGGSIRLAHTERGMALLSENHATLVREGVASRLLDAEAVTREVGTHGYVGGRLDPRSGTLHPLKYARGLAKAALDAGAILYRDTAATALRREGDRWRVVTPESEIIASRVVVATNGYTDELWPGLAQTMLPLNSFQIATAPLTEAQRAEILPSRACFSDTRRLILYAQRTRDHRLVLGGRASFTLTDRAADYDVLRRVLTGLFPQLRDTPIDYRWVGRVALTRDHLPHLHAPAPGLLIAVGFNGKGVAMTSLMGKIIADHIRAPAAPPAYPITDISPFPFHALRQPVLHLAMSYQTLMDRLGR